MVSETIDTPEVAPVEEAATTTEVVEEEQPEAPSPDEQPEVEEAPPADTQPVQVEQPPQTYTAEQVQQHAEYLAAQRLEQQRRHEQSERDKAIARQQREARDNAELRDLVDVAIARGDDATAINQLMLRYADKRRDQIVDQAASDAEQAVQWLVAPLTGQAPPTLSPEGQKFAQTIGPWMQWVVDATHPQIIQQAREGYVPLAQMEELVKAGVQAELKKTRAGATPLNRPDGASAVGGEMNAARWTSLTPEERRNPANQQAFDAWSRKNT